jgi:hypothetical protein
VLHSPDGRFEHRRRPRDRPGHCIARTIALPDIRQPVADLQVLAVRASRHIAVDQRLSHVAGRRPELAHQVSRKPAFLRFDQCAGVMRNQPAQQRFGACDVAEVPGTVERMEPGAVKIRRVADVVQPRGGFHEFGVPRKKIPQRPGRRGHALRVRPAARERVFQEFAGRILSPRGEIHELDGSPAGPGRSRTYAGRVGRLDRLPG